VAFLQKDISCYRHTFAHPLLPVIAEDYEHLAKADEDAGIYETDTTSEEGAHSIRWAEQCRKKHTAEPFKT